MSDELADVVMVEADGPVRIVTMNRPEKWNAFTAELHQRMTEVWREIGSDPDARSVVLTGAGAAFSAGGDISLLEAVYESADVRRHMIREVKVLVDEMLRFHLPVVAAVNGPAIGLGCSVAVLCDVVLIADDTYMSDPHVVMGMVAGDGGAVTWPLMMSILKAKEYLLTGDRIPAAQAVALGLANRAIPASELRSEALALAHRLAGMPAQAVQDTKRAINIHLQRAAQAVIDFASMAENESFMGDGVRVAVEKFRAARS
jgi:enoyl-CoA hydratase/carnithine racemase